jgi:hypothetical protein
VKKRAATKSKEEDGEDKHNKGRQRVRLDDKRVDGVRKERR